MFDPVNDSSYHSLSPADVNTADSQVYILYENFTMNRLLLLLLLYTGFSIKIGTRKYCTASK